MKGSADNAAANQAEDSPVKSLQAYSQFWNAVIVVPGTAASDDVDLLSIARKFGFVELAQFLAANPNLSPKRVVQSRTPADIRRLEKKSHQGAFAPDHSMNEFWRLGFQDEPGMQGVIAQLKQLDKPKGLIVYREALVSAPTEGAPGNEFLSQQQYLDEAPIGIDAKWAWSQIGGQGSDVNVIDIEAGWRFGHVDLPEVELLHGDNDLSGSTIFGAHGTYVLGVIAAINNSVGIVGVAPNVSTIKAISHFKDSETGGSHYHVAEAIVEAMFELESGDVLLLEVQRAYDGEPSQVPTETDLADFTAICNATSLGIVVVEAAGNGDGDLAKWLDADGVARLDCSDPDHDSGAIIVGASKDTVTGSPQGHERYYSSSYGCRVDCYAWGDRVITTGKGSLGNQGDINAQYVVNFAETSAAAAIIAGAAAITQSWCKQNSGAALTPAELRSVFSNEAFGTPQSNIAGDPIGVMPDLSAVMSVGLTTRRFLWRIGRLFWFIGSLLGREFYPGHRIRKWFA